MPQSAAEIVEQAIAKQEAEESGTLPADDKDDKGKQDDKDSEKGGAAGAGGSDDKGGGKDDKGSGKPAADDDSGKPKYDKDGKRIEPEKADEKKPDADKDKKDEEEGKFTADDALEVDEPKPGEPQTPTDSAGISLSQAETKYIADNIGEPLVIRGIRGEGENAKEVEIKAFTVADIPADFRFANDQQRMAAQNGFQSLERRAEQLLGNYRQNQSTAATQDFEKRENEGIRADVADLQKEGLFPKFRVQPGQVGFDEDPAAQQMTEVLKIMTERNENYLAQYNQGRPYRHIGFREAHEIWERTNPDKLAEKKADEDQSKEDQERGKVADKVSTGGGLTQPKIVKPTIRSGVTVDQILAAHEAEDM